MTESGASALRSYAIGGCEVSFPHSAYGTQLSFMGKVIHALEHATNALLEAPTGSGKTLCLLCASLAWQQKEKKRFLEGVQEFGEGSGRRELVKAEFSKDSVQGMNQERCAKLHEPCAKQKYGHVQEQEEGQGFICGEEAYRGEHIKRRPPKIYYATRTHSQIAQVVSELKRSGYCPAMVVLASKQHYCVNSHVCAQPSIEEACEEALKESQCQYFKGTQMYAATKIAVHDIEDLSKFAKPRRACPYYLSRKWHEDADLVFGPYNYLLDPVIRRSMGVELADTIVIFDEAHNIEDVSRESASLDVELDTINEMIVSLSRAVKYNMHPETYQPLLEMVTAIKAWFSQHIGNLTTNGNQQQKIWDGPQLLQHLSSMGLGAEKMETLWTAYKLAREHDEEMIARRKEGASDWKQKGDAAKIESNDASQKLPNRLGALVLGTLSRVVQICQLLHFHSDDGGRDYRLVLTKSSLVSEARHTRKRGRTILDVPSIYSMSLWCLNPAVAFRQVSSKSHSVILTSGTLAPLMSFSSELGTKFGVQLEAPHVVNVQKQVFAGIISEGPLGNTIRATYQNTSKATFQDCLGEIILSAARVVPDGLLVFFPSYSLLDRLVSRWTQTGVLNAINEAKLCLQEPRTGGSDALKEVMNRYYAQVASGSGCMLLAVCRGKISEGLDFTDSNARGVIVVGIPFPNIKDPKVESKRNFNDMGARTIGLLSGSLWYEQQAFRALNQALGRCIRHKDDWGAILLLDERFGSNSRYQNSLSRWIRSSLKRFDSFGSFEMCLEDFFSHKKREEQRNKSSHGHAFKAQKQQQSGLANQASDLQDEKGRTDAFKLLMAGHPKCIKSKGEQQSDEICSLPAQIPESTTQDDRRKIGELLQQLPIQRWVEHEVSMWSALVRSSKERTTLPPIVMAKAGIMDVFDLAQEQLRDKTVVDKTKWTTQCKAGILSAFQATFCHEFQSKMRGMEENITKDHRHTLNAEAISFGLQNLSSFDKSMLLDEFAKAYKLACCSIPDENTISHQATPMSIHAQADVQSNRGIVDAQTRSTPLAIEEEIASICAMAEADDDDW